MPAGTNLAAALLAAAAAAVVVADDPQPMRGPLLPFEPVVKSSPVDVDNHSHVDDIVAPLQAFLTRPPGNEAAAAANPGSGATKSPRARRQGIAVNAFKPIREGDECEYANDGVCDVPSSFRPTPVPEAPYHCAHGFDCTDCGSCSNTIVQSDGSKERPFISYKHECEWGPVAEEMAAAALCLSFGLDYGYFMGPPFSIKGPCGVSEIIDTNAHWTYGLDTGHNRFGKTYHEIMIIASCKPWPRSTVGELVTDADKARIAARAKARGAARLEALLNSGDIVGTKTNKEGSGGTNAAAIGAGVGAAAVVLVIILTVWCRRRGRAGEGPLPEPGAAARVTHPDAEGADSNVEAKPKCNEHEQPPAVCTPALPGAMATAVATAVPVAGASLYAHPSMAVAPALPMATAIAVPVADGVAKEDDTPPPYVPQTGAAPQPGLYPPPPASIMNPGAPWALPGQHRSNPDAIYGPVGVPTPATFNEMRSSEI